MNIDNSSDPLSGKVRVYSSFDPDATSPMTLLFDETGFTVALEFMVD